MEPRKRTDKIEVNLGDIFGLLLHRMWMILLAGFICGAVGFIYSNFFITPQYQSTTKVYILNKQNSTSVTYSDVQLSTTLSKDYEGVIKQLSLNETYESLVGRVSAVNTNDTRIIAITVTDSSAEQAQKIANAVRDLAAKHITQVMDIEAVNVVDSANLPTAPVSPSITKWTFMGIVIGIIASMIIIIVKYLLDDTIKSSEDIEKYLGISTLALIPMNRAEDENSDKRKSSNNNNGKVMKSLNDAKSKIFKS